jgi:hypothetical protein
MSPRRGRRRRPLRYYVTCALRGYFTPVMLPVSASIVTVT